MSIFNARKRSATIYANTSIFRAWASLIIDDDDDQRVEILYSLHGIGRELRGLLVCSAMAYRKVTTDEGPARVEQIEPLCESVFEITAVEPEDQMKSRFRAWMEDCLVAGLTYWQKGL